MLGPSRPGQAGEAVETVSRRTKHKFGSGSATQMGSIGSHRQRSPTKSLHSEFDKCDSIVVSPNSKFRVGWDFASVTLIILDAFLLPLTMAFDLDVSPFAAGAKGGEVLLQALAMTSLIFWPLDTCLHSEPRSVMFGHESVAACGSPGHGHVVQHRLLQEGRLATEAKGSSEGVG